MLRPYIEGEVVGLGNRSRVFKDQKTGQERDKSAIGVELIVSKPARGVAVVNIWADGKDVVFPGKIGEVWGFQISKFETEGMTGLWSANLEDCGKVSK